MICYIRSLNIAVRIEEDSFGLYDGKEELKFIFSSTLKVRYLHILQSSIH